MGPRQTCRPAFLQRPHEDHVLVAPAPDRFSTDTHRVGRLLVGFAEDKEVNGVALLNRQRFRRERGLCGVLWFALAFMIAPRSIGDVGNTDRCPVVRQFQHIRILSRLVQRRAFDGRPPSTDTGSHTDHAYQAWQARVWVACLVPLTHGDVTAEGDDLRISVELLPIALGTPAFHSFLRFPRGHQVSALDHSMGFRRDHASSGSPSARDGPGLHV